MSEKIPNDPPKSPQVSHKEEDVQQPISSPQIGRSSIPPSLSQGKVNVEKMTSLAKEKQKRKREATEEKELEPLQPIEKKRELESESKKKIEILHEKASECFGPLSQKLDNLESIANFCFKSIRKRVCQSEPLKTEEIVKIYQLLFETDLKSICEPILSEPLNPINPHSVYVFKSLYECIKLLDEYPTFKDAVLASQEYIESNKLQAFFDQNLEMRKQILPLILEQVSNYQELLDNCPIYTTTTLLQSKNIHAAFVLRNMKHENRWVFKPTAEMSPQGLQSLQSDYTLVNSEREHLATLLNFHRGFPIPATYLIEIKGAVGSVQIFLNGTKEEIEESNVEDLSIDEMQSLLIFDLVFANCDRHMDNILPIRAGTLHVNGIDHDACFAFDNRPLKIDYLRYARPFNCPFVSSIHRLISEENVEKYAKIIKNSGQDQQAIEWMLYAAEYIKKSFNQHRTAELIAKNLMADFCDRYVV